MGSGYKPDLNYNMTLPNQLTVLRIILTPIFAFALFKQGFNWKFIAVLIFIVASLTDFYDGIIARKYGYVSQWGKFLDPLADKILVSTAMVSLAMLGYIQMWMVIVIIFRDVVITILRSYAMFRKQSIRTMKIAKWKTAVQDAVVYFVLLFMLVEEHFLTAGTDAPLVNFIRNFQFIEIFMWIATILTVFTGVKYLVDNKEHTKSLLQEFIHVFASSDVG